jgi:tRNA-splicing ligase RtcB
MPIGGAAAYKNLISPSGVGFDIACGNKAVKTDLKAKDVDISKIMDEVTRRISFGIGRINNEPADHPVLEKISSSDFLPQKKMAKLAAELLVQEIIMLTCLRMKMVCYG